MEGESVEARVGSGSCFCSNESCWWRQRQHVPDVPQGSAAGLPLASVDRTNRCSVPLSESVEEMPPPTWGNSEYLRRLLVCLLEAFQGAPNISIIERDIQVALREAKSKPDRYLEYFSRRRRRFLELIEELSQARNDYAHERDVERSQIDEWFHSFESLTKHFRPETVSLNQMRALNHFLFLRAKWQCHKRSCDDDGAQQLLDNYDYLYRVLKVVGKAFRKVYAHITSPSVGAFKAMRKVGSDEVVVEENDLDSYYALQHARSRIDMYNNVLNILEKDQGDLKRSMDVLFCVRNSAMHDTNIDISDDALRFVFTHAEKLLLILKHFHQITNNLQWLQKHILDLKAIELMWTSSRLSDILSNNRHGTCSNIPLKQPGCWPFALFKRLFRTRVQPAQ